MHIQPTTLDPVPALPRPRPQAQPALAGDSFQAGEAPPELMPRSISSPELPTVGSQRSFWVWDMAVMPPGFKQIQATCRAVGPESYVFVDDSVPVSDEAIATVDRRLHREGSTGSVDPRRGFAAINNDYFGAPALGQDNDRKAYVLITELAPFNGMVMDGYVNAFDSLTEEEAWREYGQHSNQAEVVYLNHASKPVDSDYMLGVLAHEYQHLCHQAADPDEESWVNEMVAEAAMSVNGYHTDMGHVARYASKSDHPPLVSQTYVSYGACMLFGTYLQERYGKGFFQALVANPDNGTAGIDSTLQSFGRPERFDDLYKDWVVANYADSRGVIDPGLHYGTLDLPAMTEARSIDEFPDLDSAELAASSVRYLKLALPEAGRVEIPEGLSVQLLSFEGGRMTRTELTGPEAELPAGNDRVLVVANPLSEKLSYTLRIWPAED